MKLTNPDAINQADRTKLLSVYMRLCPDDQVTDDDPRRPVIAAEVLDVGRAPTFKEALDVIEYWQQPADWAKVFVGSVRHAVARMKLDVA